MFHQNRCIENPDKHEKQPLNVLYKNAVRDIHRKAPVLEFLFNKVAVILCEYCKMLKKPISKYICKGPLLKQLW